MKFIALFTIFTCSLCKFDAVRIYFPDEITELPTETPKSILQTTEFLPRGNLEQEEVSAPNFTRDFFCGYTYSLGVFSGILLNNETVVPLYHLNKTAEKLASKGFKIFDQNVSLDVLFNFTFSNGSFTDTIGYEYYRGIAPVGGKPASYIRAYYMAQLGEIIGDKIIWLCDGVLINRQWILSAAHCFISSSGNPNIVRLGDYNISQPVEEGFNIRGKFIEDYPIEEIVPFPEFNARQRYHDLVLIKIPRKIPKYSASINPICLPWGNHTNLNLVGSEVVLTGWGATEYGGSKTKVLQEVDLKVFNTSVCDKAYSEVRDNRNRYPDGLTDDTILCIGWEEDGKDACKGDSGAPVVYQDGGEIHGDFILAGIASGGYGCGLKEYPGLYIPINKPKYLRWIKEIAFKEYN